MPHSAIWQLVSHPPSEASANGYLTREVWRASIHSLSLSHTHTKPYKQSNSGSYWSKSLSWSLVIIVDAVSPACPSCKYFLGVNTCSNSRLESCMAYLSSSTLAARLFASVTHFTFLIKTEKQWVCLNSGRQRYAALHHVTRREVGMRNVKQMPGSSALPAMAEQRHPLMPLCEFRNGLRRQ